MAYIGSSPTKVVSRQSANIFTYTATANQTAFTGADDNSNTLACSPSDIMVHMNGIKLEESDYTATTTTVTLGSGAAAGDEVTITAFLTFESADHYTKSAADTRYVNATGDNITGSLGINNATPSFPLHIKGSTNTNAILGVESANWTTGATAELRLAYTAGYNRSIKGHHDNGLQFFTNPTNPSLQIDNSGRVTTPNQPSFFVQKNNGNHTTTANIVYNNVVHNEGSHYSTSNGRFTAPVAGKYLFSATGICGNSTATSASGDVRITVNGSTYVRGHFNMSDQWESITSQAVISLSVNDYVNIYFEVGSGSPYMYGYAQYAVFSGHLLG